MATKGGRPRRKPEKTARATAMQIVHGAYKRFLEEKVDIAEVQEGGKKHSLLHQKGRVTCCRAHGRC